ncbi:AroM family protein [Gottfriedia acidiceleris]|uniref:AroM family protein n=1 Tax=Gottfriedia acidiceleris TaxID=371036 RepID=UPI003D1C284F
MKNICHLKRGGGDVLTTRLSNGNSVVISREKIHSILQDKIYRLEEMGVKQILLLCTGVFPGLQTKTSHLIEPDRIIPPVIKAIVGQRRLGVIAPLAEQIESLREKFSHFSMSPHFAVASPYQNNVSNFERAAIELEDQSDIILLDCMAYTEQARRIVSKLTGLPVIVSNEMMGKLVSEMV